ncbi:hypothetical protein AUI46_04275 [archaeon 13_1_40CM_2_52_13]|nr:MAG: hypothetical protein AUI46_04275 [archaeon 13_1_40CM_2_52_13]OLE69357.1 MAG: hypothetical protein AUF78_11420 [archaeon 13_1_20CM_2_51_12]
MGRLTRDEQQAVEDRVFDFVQNRIGALALVDARLVAGQCRLHQQNAKTILLSLALEGRILAAHLNGKWVFSPKR